ncbi:uncharacterized protein BDW43DRAFT_316398 [Aspergillus alliaceus]|uniref:uncharacterized protein n=1 Tax=Petromyces alliaceus TaxID=209559 RepID=UPI0012A66E71|nr:uncharacterized protein BDW43DRAFT_316398 [Aspergillus alliaceus]KAB8227885.1 hypothetical protein BDW43DRAFT_316398 [Aspergillus alliaceus]
MGEVDQVKLHQILKEHYINAVGYLKRYLSGNLETSKSLDAVNIQIQEAIIAKLSWEPKMAEKFQVPYTKLSEIINPLVVQPLQNDGSERTAEVFAKKLGESKINLYHFCVHNNIQLEWLDGLLEEDVPEIVCPPKIYNEDNTDIRSYWPYNYLATGQFDVLYEKKKRAYKGDASSFAVQVRDPDSGKFRVEMRATIGNNNLERWRRLPNTYKFYAGDRDYKKSVLGEIVYVYFYTMVQPKTGSPESKASANTDICVKFENSIMPLAVTRSKASSYLPEGESIDDIIEKLSSRDDILVPRKLRAKSVKFSLSQERRTIPTTTLAEELFRRNEAQSSLRNVSAYSRASVPPESPKQATSFYSPFSSRRTPLSQSSMATTATLADTREIEDIYKQIDALSKRLDEVEENVVTKEYLDGSMAKIIAQMTNLLGLEKRS